MNKRGLSTVITTMIIILLVLVAVGIVWVVIKNLIDDQIDEINLSKFTISFKVKMVESSGSSINFTLQREPGKGELIGLKFAFNNETNSESFEEYIVIPELGSNRFNFILSDVSDVTDMLITPILESTSGEKIFGNPIKYKIKRDSTSSGTIPATCNNGSIDTSLGEVCDGTDFGPLTCASELGIGHTGSLACASNCLSFNTGDCIAPGIDCDADNDGYDIFNSTCPTVSNIDCNDDLASINPGATEGPYGDATCSDGDDNNCNGNIDMQDINCNDTLFLKSTFSNSLISWWRMNGNTNDEMGINNGLPTGASLVNGRFGGAYELNTSVIANITIPHSETLNFGTNKNFSIIAWTKTGDNYPNDMHYILSKYSANKGYLFFSAVGALGDDRLFTSVGYGVGLGDSLIMSSTVINDNTWKFYATTYERDVSINTYINGSEATDTSPIPGSSGRDISNNADAIVGNWDNQNLMTIDELMIFNRSLSSSEIDTIYSLNLSH